MTVVQPQVRRAWIVIETDDQRMTVAAEDPYLVWQVQVDRVTAEVHGWLQQFPIPGSAHIKLEMNGALEMTVEALGSPGLAAAARPSPGEVSGPRAGEGRGAPCPHGFMFAHEGCGLPDAPADGWRRGVIATGESAAAEASAFERARFLPGSAAPGGGLVGLPAFGADPLS